MAPARAEKIDLSKFKIRIFLRKGIFELKTVYFADKPISDGLF